MRARLLIPALAVAATAGCGPHTGLDRLSGPCRGDLVIVSGSGQRATAGSMLPVVLEVSPRMGSGFLCEGLAPVAGVQILWSVESGGGTVMAVTDGARYLAHWTLGPSTGRQAVRATWTGSGQPPLSVLFEATAEPRTAP